MGRGILFEGVDHGVKIGGVDIVIDVSIGIGNAGVFRTEAPLAVHDELVLVGTLAEGEQDGEISAAIGEVEALHGFLALPPRPIAHYRHLLRVLVGVRHPVEVDGLGGATALVGVAALQALLLFSHSYYIITHPHPPTIVICIEVAVIRELGSRWL
jgi:hypothetical protein